MSFVDVDVTSFEKVRDSLKTFKGNISGFSSKISRNTTEVVSSCDKKLKAQEKKLKELKNLLCPLVLPKHPRVVETNNFSECSDCNS